jgi:type IV pilus assembly protein PilO
MADNALAKLSLAGQLGVSLVLAAIVGGAFYYFIYSDMVDDEQRKTAQLKTIGDEIRALEVTKNKLQEFRQEVEQRKAKLELLKRILPADKETPELMKKVQYLATQSNLSIKRFTPGPTVTKQFEPPPGPGAPGAPGAPAAQPSPRPGQPQQAQDSYQEWPINMDLEGTYHNLGLFLDRVSRLSRLVNVGNVKIKAQSQPRLGNTVTVSSVATTYVYVEAPRTPPGQPGRPPATGQ